MSWGLDLELWIILNSLPALKTLVWSFIASSHHNTKAKMKVLAVLPAL